MKKIIVSSLLLLLTLNIFSQQIKLSPALNPDAFLKKSNRQKSTAIILLCSGAVISASSVFIQPMEKIIPGSRGTHYDYTLNNIISITGFAAMGVSIPLFIAAKKNSHSALLSSARLKIEKANIIQQSNQLEIMYPAVSFKISYNY